ncbi:hypothetical protein ACH3XW_27610 [Acanthocheilonema viteae]
MHRSLKVSIIFFLICSVFSFEKINKRNESTKEIHYESDDQSEDNIYAYFSKFLTAKIEAIRHGIAKLGNDECVKVIAIVFLAIIFFLMVCLCSTIITYKLFECLNSEESNFT